VVLWPPFVFFDPSVREIEASVRDFDPAVRKIAVTVREIDPRFVNFLPLFVILGGLLV